MKKLMLSFLMMMLIISCAVTLTAQNTAEKNYRLYNNTSYKILDTDGFFLYSRYAYAPGKSSMKVCMYYFSKDVAGSIRPLTVTNLNDVFAGNARFRYAIDGMSNSKLIEYDSYIKTYKIKYLYAQSLKQ